jgi:mRNA interferase RelE/StbE
MVFRQRPRGLTYELQIGPQVRALQTTLGLRHRRAVKEAIRALAGDKGDLRSLCDELSGWNRLKVGPYRLIFRYVEGKKIQCVYLNERKLVYEIFAAEMSRIVGGG